MTNSSRHYPPRVEHIPYFKYWKNLVFGGISLDSNQVADLRDTDARGLFYLDLLYHFLPELLERPIQRDMNYILSGNSRVISGTYHNMRVRARYICPNPAEGFPRLSITLEDNEEVGAVVFTVNRLSEDLIPIKRDKIPFKLKELLDQLEIQASRIMRHQIEATLPSFKLT